MWLLLARDLFEKILRFNEYWYENSSKFTQIKWDQRDHDYRDDEEKKRIKIIPKFFTIFNVDYECNKLKLFKRSWNRKYISIQWFTRSFSVIWQFKVCVNHIRFDTVRVTVFKACISLPYPWAFVTKPCACQILDPIHDDHPKQDGDMKHATERNAREQHTVTGTILKHCREKHNRK